MNTGTVYILTNECMPGYIKIGRTQGTVIRRMRDLDKTNIALPFECYYACKVQDPEKVETMLHRVFACDRVRDRREFFTTKPHRVEIILKHIELEDVTPENQETGVTKEDRSDDKKAILEAKKKKSRLTFDMVGLSKGDILYSSFDPEITCTVYDNNQVEYRGEIMSLSRSAAFARSLVVPGISESDALQHSLQGGRYWTTKDGITLVDLRETFE